MLLIAFTVLIVLISIVAPLWLSVILLGLNLIIPDSIPLADEFIQGMAVAGKMKNSVRVMKSASWAFNNPAKSIALSVVAVSALFVFLG